jgi:hypothetical protein
MIAVALAECAVAEGQRRLKYHPKKDSDDATPTNEKSNGLGIASRIAPAKEEADQTPTTTPSINVTVNNGTNSADMAQVEKLAGYVVKGPAYMRDSRKRSAVDVLKSMTEDSSEREQLAISLDAAIKKLDAKESGGSTSLRTSAMNKLKEFLR